MTPRLIVFRLRALTTACVLLALHASAQPIRLRNEVIDTAPVAAARVAKAPPNEPAVSGLFLIQFTGPSEAAWREQLRERRVELLRYVPDNAFIARFDNVRPQQVKALPFVRWVGEYRADHKLHAALRGGPGARQADAADVNVLLSSAATPGELAGARGALQRLHHESRSRFGTVLRGRMTRVKLAALAQSPAVLWIEPAPKMKLFDEVATKIVAGDGGPNQSLMQAFGLDGAGVTVAVADSGLHTGSAATMHPDLSGRVSAFFFYGALTDASDEHSHGTHVTGIIGGNGAVGEVDENGALYGLGVAPGVNIVAQRIFDGLGGYEAPPTFETLTRDAVRAGADIGSNSWGDDTQGRYDISAMEFDAHVRDADELALGDQQYILEFSAGNAGPGAQTIGSPAVAKNVIASGATQNNRPDFFIYGEGPEVMADFSSRGPCEDGRIKPDVVAPGTWIASLQSAAATDENAWSPISPYYQYQGGTSQSGPHVSGAAAILVQYFREAFGMANPSPALIKAALINCAVNMDDEVETGPAPNMDEGWGRVDLTRIVYAARNAEVLDQTHLLTTSQTYERRLIVASRNEPLRITLTYTDVPGFPGAIPALVNDLDLEVVAPDGTVYRGNQFEEGESVPNAPSADPINNVEGVHLGEPLPGEYIVRVRARNVPQDARRETGAIDQDFALVMSGDIPYATVGVMILDRAAYTAPGRIRLQVFDTDLTGQPSATVQLTSSTEPAGFNVTLLPSGTPGSFTGSVATAIGPAANDGVLQIAHGGAIQAGYFDASSGGLRFAVAGADLLPPVITSVAATNQYGVISVSWMTDEPANSIVRFSTNSTLSRAATNQALVTSHEINLANLIVGRTYRFAVSSTDAAGNTATNNNGGTNFTFLVTPAATVLLVNNYQSDGMGFGPDLPLSSYTTPLSQVGVSYSVWDMTTGRPSPGINDLRPFRVVIWRVSDNVFLNNTLSPQEQTAVRQYVDGGGSFFMASMEQPSRLPATFLRDVLHVTSAVEEPTGGGVPGVTGVSGNTITAGLDLPLDYSDYETETYQLFGVPADVSDTLTLTNNAAGILQSSLGGICGVMAPRFGSTQPGRVVFLSFPLEAVPESGADPNNRANLLRNILSFLAPGADGLGTITLDNTRYPETGLAGVEVGDSDLSGQSQATVTFYSDTQPGGVTVALPATTEPELFRGFVTLVAAADAPGPGRLRVQHGDALWAEYFDASGNGLVRASAVVDAQPPFISGLVATPDYEEATVAWDTSEATDALVQFGESTFLGRTAYRDEFDTSHEVRLPGLQPNRLYYYQVVSRDVAGNTVIDDNGGQFHTLQTLAPLQPPFFDNMDTGASPWSVFSSDESFATWTLGVPDNGVETEAVSPPHAWGSTLNGESIDTADTFLISPAIDLTGGNTATLRFWHSYDFTERTQFDLSEGGELLVIVNGQAVTLGQWISEANGGWDLEEIDLTPYLGHVISLVWHHQLLAFEAAPRPGWLVDDVSVEVTTVVPGVIQVSNNLAQGRFVLTGPLSRSAQGINTVISNAPPGDYTVTFGTVLYHTTPPAQTATLTEGGTLFFAGHYTFPDANTNGISDLWEQFYFPGGMTGNDADNDGFSNYAEFIAGTHPGQPDSRLRLATPTVLPSGAIRLEWPSFSGRAYRVLGSADAVNWSPASNWIQATSGATTFTLPPPAAGAPYLFRVEVRP